MSSSNDSNFDAIFDSKLKTVLCHGFLIDENKHAPAALLDPPKNFSIPRTKLQHTLLSPNNMINSSKKADLNSQIKQLLFQPDSLNMYGLYSDPVKLHEYNNSNVQFFPMNSEDRQLDAIDDQSLIASTLGKRLKNFVRSSLSRTHIAYSKCKNVLSKKSGRSSSIDDEKSGNSLRWFVAHYRETYSEPVEINKRLDNSVIKPGVLVDELSAVDSLDKASHFVDKYGFVFSESAYRYRNVRVCVAEFTQANTVEKSNSSLEARDFFRDQALQFTSLNLRNENKFAEKKVYETPEFL
jgi:hypothetical protein